MWTYEDDLVTQLPEVRSALAELEEVCSDPSVVQHWDRAVAEGIRWRYRHWVWFWGWG